MARGKGKNWPKLKILAVLKSAHQKFLENALSQLKILFCEEEFLVVKKGNRLSILPIRNDIAKILLEKI